MQELLAQELLVKATLAAWLQQLAEQPEAAAAALAQSVETLLLM
jgi:hypothetical protein